MNLVRDNKLLSMMKRSDEPYFNSHLTACAHDSGTILQRAGESAKYVHFPTSGMISLLTVMKNGDSIETGAIGYDGALGYNSALSGLNANCQSIVQLASTSMRISKDHFSHAFEASAGVRRMVHIANEQVIAQAQQTAACHALHNAEQRFARWLLVSHDYAGVDGLELTQEFIGEMIGIRRPTISITATHLQDAGLIVYNRGRITILNRAGLEAISCECYKTVHDVHIGKVALKPVAHAPLPAQ